MSAICIFPQTQLNYTCHLPLAPLGRWLRFTYLWRREPPLPKFSFQRDCLPAQPPPEMMGLVVWFTFLSLSLLWNVPPARLCGPRVTVYLPLK